MAAHSRAVIRPEPAVRRGGIGGSAAAQSNVSGDGAGPDVSVGAFKVMAERLYYDSTTSLHDLTAISRSATIVIRFNYMSTLEDAGCGRLDDGPFQEAQNGVVADGHAQSSKEALAAQPTHRTLDEMYHGAKSLGVVDPLRRGAD